MVRSSPPCAFEFLYSSFLWNFSLLIYVFSWISNSFLFIKSLWLMVTLLPKSKPKIKIKSKLNNQCFPKPGTPSNYFSIPLLYWKHNLSSLPQFGKLASVSVILLNLLSQSHFSLNQSKCHWSVPTSLITTSSSLKLSPFYPFIWSIFINPPATCHTQ